MKYVVVDDIEAMGASKSLYATMKDIERMIEGLPLDKASPLRKKLRHRIRKAIYQFEEQYYRRGYRQGVYAACEKLDEKGKILGIVRKVIRVRFRAGDPDFSKPKKVILEAEPANRKK